MTWHYESIFNWFFWEDYPTRDGKCNTEIQKWKYMDFSKKVKFYIQLSQSHSYFHTLYTALQTYSGIRHLNNQRTLVMSSEHFSKYNSHCALEKESNFVAWWLTHWLYVSGILWEIPYHAQWPGNSGHMWPVRGNLHLHSLESPGSLLLTIWGVRT